MAANDLISVYDPTFWAQETLLQLFPMLKFGNMVYREFDSQIAEKGDTVNTRLPNKFVAQDVNPDSFASVKPKADNVQVKLDQWKHVTFEIGDKEAGLSLKNLQEEFAYPAAEAIAEVIERAIIGLYTDTYQSVGQAGQTPSTVASLGTDIKQACDQALLPQANRMVAFGPAAVNKFNQVFFQAQVSGSTEQQTTGNLTTKFGLNYTDSVLMPHQTIGTAWNGSIAAGVQTGTVRMNGPQTLNNGNAYSLGQAPGTQVVNLKGLTASSTINKGDIFMHAGSSYAVTANAVSDGSGLAAVTVTPALVSNAADGDVITNLISHDVNLAFHKQAFSLVTRPLNVPTVQGANVSVIDFGGIGIRSATWYKPELYRTYVRMDVLFGVKTLDARKAIRVLG